MGTINRAQKCSFWSRFRSRSIPDKGQRLIKAESFAARCHAGESTIFVSCVFTAAFASHCRSQMKGSQLHKS